MGRHVADGVGQRAHCQEHSTEGDGQPRQPPGPPNHDHHGSHRDQHQRDDQGERVAQQVHPNRSMGGIDDPALQPEEPERENAPRPEPPQLRSERQPADEADGQAGPAARPT